MYMTGKRGYLKCKVYTQMYFSLMMTR